MHIEPAAHRTRVELMKDALEAVPLTARQINAPYFSIKY